MNLSIFHTFLKPLVISDYISVNLIEEINNYNHTFIQMNKR